MACLLSTSFAIPFSASNSFFFNFQELHPKKTPFVRRLRQPTYITATKLSTSCSIVNAISSSNQSYWDHLLPPLRHQWGLVSYHMNVHSSSHMIISGYWVGPDVDDGWGYIDAFINPII